LRDNRRLTCHLIASVGLVSLEENGAILHYSLNDERLTDRVVQDIKEGPLDQNKWSFPEIPF